MKGRRSVRFFNLKCRSRMPALLFLSGCFFCGVLAGCLWADSVAESGGAALSEYISCYLAALQEGNVTTSSFGATLWDVFRWPLFTILAAFTVPGLVVIPAIFLLRGFLLSFSVACFVRVLGSAGILLALVLFGVSGVLSLPILFILGTYGVAACRKLCLRLLGTWPRTEAIYGNTYMIRCGLCMVLLCICVLGERLLVPALLTVLVSSF